jgi:hypothetical protein
LIDTHIKIGSCWGKCKETAAIPRAVESVSQPKEISGRTHCSAAISFNDNREQAQQRRLGTLLGARGLDTHTGDGTGLDTGCTNVCVVQWNGGAVVGERVFGFCAVAVWVFVKRHGVVVAVDGEAPVRGDAWEEICAASPFRAGNGGDVCSNTGSRVLAFAFAVELRQKDSFASWTGPSQHGDIVQQGINEALTIEVKDGRQCDACEAACAVAID